MKKGYISNPVISRMPRYFRCVDELYHEKCVRVSSAALAEKLGLTASQVRQDFSCFGEFGQQGYGYNVETLREEIGNILGLPTQNSVIVVGCGNLGHAILNNFDFSVCGMSLIGAFDVSPDLIGQRIGSVTVRSFDDLEATINSAHPEIAVLCVPRNFAQSVADQLIALGIRGIWNFTNHELSVPDKIKIENVVFQDSLLLLGYKINEGQEG